MSDAPESLQDQIRRAHEELGGTSTVTELSRQFECSRNTVYQALQNVPYVNPDLKAKPEITFRESGDERDITITTDKPIKTLDDLIRAADIDTKVWRVKSWEPGAWNVPVKITQGVDADGRRLPDRVEIKQMYKVSAKLERLLPKPYLDALDSLYERFSKPAAKYTQVVRNPVSARPCMLEIDLFDMHFGKLAWGAETGEDYDLKIAERIFADAVNDLIDEAAGRSIEEILFPISNDFLHVDGPANVTANGTIQDTDGRFAKIVEVSSASMVWALERASQVANVRVIRVPGNHDRMSSMHLLNYLSAYFRNDPSVSISKDKRDRQFHAYGTNLIGFTHGCEEKPSSLPAIMAIEVPILWAGSTYREWHLGHFHKTKRVEFANVDQHDGVVIRYLQSLSGRDAWHYRRGYVGGRRAAEAMIFDRDRGLVANFQAFLRAA